MGPEKLPIWYIYHSFDVTRDQKCTENMTPGLETQKVGNHWFNPPVPPEEFFHQKIFNLLSKILTLLKDEVILTKYLLGAFLGTSAVFSGALGLTPQIF